MRDDQNLGEIGLDQINRFNQALATLHSTMDEVKHQVLPSRGYLLTLTKRAR